MNSSAKLDEPGIVSDRAGVYDHYRIAGKNWEFYENIRNRIGIPEPDLPGLLGHFAGENEEGLEIIDFWTDRRTMDDFFTDVAADAIIESIGETGVRVDVEPEVREVERLVLGMTAADFLEPGADNTELALAGRGLHPASVMTVNRGGTEADYLRACERLGFPTRVPKGLIIHAAGPCMLGWRIFECWDSEKHLARFRGRVAIEIAKPHTDAGRPREPVIRDIKPKRVVIDESLIARVSDERDRVASGTDERPEE